MNLYNLRTLHPKFQKIWAKNKVARALPCLAWAPPNLAGRRHLATGFCFGPFAKLCLVRLISNFESKFLEYWGNYVLIAIWIGENSEQPNLHSFLAKPVLTVKSRQLKTKTNKKRKSCCKDETLFDLLHEAFDLMQTATICSKFIDVYVAST